MILTVITAVLCCICFSFNFTDVFFKPFVNPFPLQFSGPQAFPFMPAIIPLVIVLVIYWFIPGWYNQWAAGRQILAEPVSVLVQPPESYPTTFKAGVIPEEPHPSIQNNITQLNSSPDRVKMCFMWSVSPDLLALNARFVHEPLCYSCFRKGSFICAQDYNNLLPENRRHIAHLSAQYFILLIIGLTSGISALLIIAFTFILADYSLMIVFAILLCCEMVGVVLSMRLMNRFLAFLRAIYPRNVLIPQSYEQWMGSRSI